MASINQIIPEFNSADFRAFVQSESTDKFLYPKYFENSYNTDLSYKTIEKEEGASVMASIVALDSHVPLARRGEAKIYRGDLPKIETGRKKSERDLFQLNQLRNALHNTAGNRSVQNKFIEAMYDDVLDVKKAVHARLEYMTKTLLSEGVYTHEESAEGRLREVRVDFNIPQQNATLDFFDAKNAGKYTPIKEIEKIQSEALSRGYQYTHMVMDLATFNQFAASEEVQKYAASYAQNIFAAGTTPTLDQLNGTLLSRRLPQIILWDSYVTEEKNSGARTTHSGWTLGNIHFCTSADLGQILYTLSPEVNLNLGETTKEIGDDFILVSTFGHLNPVEVITKATAFATPVLHNPSRRLILKTKLK